MPYDVVEMRPYIDLESGLGRLRGNKKLYKRMLGMLKVSEDFAAFEAGIAAGDMQRAEAHIHSIKGMTGNLSLTALFDLSAALNAQLRDGAYSLTTLEEYRKAYTATMGFVDLLLAELGD